MNWPNPHPDSYLTYLASMQSTYTAFEQHLLTALPLYSSFITASSPTFSVPTPPLELYVPVFEYITSEFPDVFAQVLRPAPGELGEEAQELIEGWTIKMLTLWRFTESRASFLTGIEAICASEVFRAYASLHYHGMKSKTVVRMCKPKILGVNRGLFQQPEVLVYEAADLLQVVTTLMVDSLYELLALMDSAEFRRAMDAGALEEVEGLKFAFSGEAESGLWEAAEYVPHELAPRLKSQCTGLIWSEACARLLRIFAQVKNSVDQYDAKEQVMLEMRGEVEDALNTKIASLKKQGLWDDWDIFGGEVLGYDVDLELEQKSIYRCIQKYMNFVDKAGLSWDTWPFAMRYLEAESVRDRVMELVLIAHPEILLGMLEWDEGLVLMTSPDTLVKVIFQVKRFGKETLRSAFIDGNLQFFVPTFDTFLAQRADQALTAECCSCMRSYENGEVKAIRLCTGQTFQHHQICSDCARHWYHTKGFLQCPICRDDVF